NEQTVLLTRLLAGERDLQTEFVGAKETDYNDFAQAFERAAKHISCLKPARFDLAWKQLHLFQLLQRDLMASAYIPSRLEEEKKAIYQPLFNAFRCIVEKTFECSILDRMSPSVLVTWVRIAKELDELEVKEAVAVVKPHLEQALRMSIRKIADSLWRFQ